MLNGFIVYSSKDEDYLQAILSHLRRPLKNYVQFWSSKEISPGERWDNRIKERLTNADIIIMLISSSFLDSDYIMNDELPTAIKRHKNNECVLIPILIKQCVIDEEEDLIKLQFLPEGKKPVGSLTNNDDVLAGIAKSVRDLVRSYNEEKKNQNYQFKLDLIREHLNKTLKRFSSLKDLLEYVPNGTLKLNAQKTININDFFISKNLITHGIWQDVMEGYYPDFKLIENNPNMPINHINWSNIQQFLERINQENDIKFRLPTEAEWMLAAKGGHNSSLHDGNEYIYAGSNTLDPVGWYEENSGSQIRPVAEKKPNGLGLYDMCGNVWEVCDDDWKNDFYSGQDGYKSYSFNTRSNYKVLKGGSAASTKDRCSISSRDCISITDKSKFVGFRIITSDITHLKHHI